MPGSRKILQIMISSTGELSRHRVYLRDRLGGMAGVKAQIQDFGTGSDRPPIETSLKWVEQSDLVIFLLGKTYGSLIPTGEKSYCEAEWDKAQELNKICLAFIIADEYPIDQQVLDTMARDPETVERQLRFREKIEQRLTRPDRGFTGLEDLGLMVLTAVSNTLRDLDARSSSRRAAGGTFQPPLPPTPYIPHVYTLSAGRFVGRAQELAMLNAWADDGSEPVLTLVGLGGMGKTALAWQWVREEIPKLKRPFEGVFWWSFYEENAGYADFLAHALAYCTERAPETLLRQSVEGNVRELIATLNHRRFLLCLDGLERIMYGYRNFDLTQAAGDADVEVGEAGVAEQDLDALYVGHNVERMAGQRYRRTVDRAGSFLQQICAIQESRIVVTSRLRPADLEVEERQYRAGVRPHERMSLSDKDAVALVKSLGVTGSSAAILRVANLVDNHPLTIRVLAGEIRNNKRAGRSFDKWLRLHPLFDPTTLRLVQRKTHILQIALRGLRANQVAALASVAAFRGPAAYDDLCRILIDYSAIVEDEDELSRLLDELEDRLLVGHDQVNCTYDMHPIIRGLTWRGIGKTGREYIASLHGEHFGGLGAAGEIPGRGLFVLQQMFFSLIELGRHDEAHELITDRIENLIVKDGKVREVSEMLDIFVDRQGGGRKLLIGGTRNQRLLHDLAFCLSYERCGVEAFQFEAQVVLDLKPHLRTANENVVFLRNVVVSLMNLAQVADAARLWAMWKPGIRQSVDDVVSQTFEVDGLLLLARGEHQAGLRSVLRYLACVRDDWPPSWIATACAAALQAADVIGRKAPGFEHASVETLSNFARRHAGKHGLIEESSLAAIYRIEREGLQAEAKEIPVAALQRHIELARLRRLVRPETAGLEALMTVALSAGAHDVAETAMRDLAELDLFHDDFERQAASWLAIARYHLAMENEPETGEAARRALWLATDAHGTVSFADVEQEAFEILGRIPPSARGCSFEPRPLEIVQELVERLAAG